MNHTPVMSVIVSQLLQMVERGLSLRFSGRLGESAFYPLLTVPVHFDGAQPVPPHTVYGEPILLYRGVLS